jgi:signal transduction histidine kinase/ActR/RegA family two-component response regulator
LRQARINFIHSSAIPLTAGFLGVAILSGVTLWFVKEESQSRAFNAQALDVAIAVNQLQSNLQDAETGQRGYLLVNDESYLVPYRRALVDVEKQFDALEASVQHQDVASQAAALRGLARDKLEELRRTVELARNGQRDNALAMVQLGTGKALMDRFRDIAAGIVNKERALAEASQSRIVWASSALTILMALAGSYREMVRLVKARDELAHANGRLLEEAEHRAQLEAQLRQSQKMEAIGQLTGGLAHDFNNMLAVVIGSLNLLKRRIARGEAGFQQFIEAALDGAQRAATLTHRLLAFARQQPLAPQPLDANKFISGLSDLLRRTLGEETELETVLGGGLWLTNADPGQLENSVLNLAINARDAMPQGGKLTIETANCHLDERYSADHVDVPAGQYVLVAVSDTGSGMSQETIARAFEPFFTTKSVNKGTGLGLSQVHGFIRQSGGHIKIYSELDRGTTIKLYMPRYFGAAADQLAPKAPQKIQTGNEVILVVEDEQRARQISCESLRELGYSVLSADNGMEALKIIDARDDIALLFTDIVMPQMNGKQLATEALRRRPSIKVLYTTGFTRNAVVHNNVIDPGVEMIAKPFSLDQLAAKVREVIEKDC